MDAEHCQTCKRKFANQPEEYRDPYFEEQGVCSEQCAEQMLDEMIENEVDEVLLRRAHA